MGTGDARARSNGFVLGSFRAAWWLPGGHAQTVGGKYLRPLHALELTPERWHTPDGDFLDLDFAPDPGPSAPIVVVLHGLGGFTRRPYMLAAYRELGRRGLLAVGLNFRGCGAELNRLPRLYHSGETGDLGFVVDTLAARFPGRPLAGLGFSLGGNVLLKYLGERGADSPLGAGATISVPFDLAAGSRQLEAGPMGRAYTRYFLKHLKEKAEGKAHLVRPVIDLDAALAAETIWEFDDRATAPLHGFTDASDYYTRSSSKGFLDAVRRPTLLIQSRNDPFFPYDPTIEREAHENPHLEPAFFDGGGHVGFVGGRRPWAPVFWAEAEAARFLASQLARTDDALV
jgi:predicted alpha/beta-fold hydrolase